MEAGSFVGPFSRTVKHACLQVLRQYSGLGRTTAKIPDRTGIIVAAILSAIGVDPNLIRDDYHLSVGDLQPGLFARALDTFAEPSYFRRVDRTPFRDLFLNSPGTGSPD